MYEFSKEKREAALDVCTSYIKRGQNVNNRASGISIGLLLQELSDEEINKIIEEKFLRSAKICVPKGPANILDKSSTFMSFKAVIFPHFLLMFRAMLNGNIFTYNKVTVYV